MNKLIARVGAFRVVRLADDDLVLETQVGVDALGCESWSRCSNVDERESALMEMVHDLRKSLDLLSEASGYDV